MFLRTKFICIIWTENGEKTEQLSSWGLSLFVLFEHHILAVITSDCSWGLSLFVLFERWQQGFEQYCVLED